MLVLITYDVNTADAAGRKRLRQIARQCVNYGFECKLDPAQYKLLQAKLCAIMAPERDSLRFYSLGNRYEQKIEHFGCKQTYLPDEPLILERAKSKMTRLLRPVRTQKA